MFKMRRKPSDTQATFNKLTALRLHNWFAHAGLLMAYHRVLKLVFKAAWKEKASPLDHKANPLQLVREFRDHTWWFLVQAGHTRAELREQQLQHRRSGKLRIPWDEVFVMVYGPTWRNFRDEHSGLAEWMQHCPSFMDAVCEKWGLPKTPKRQDKEPWAPLRCRIPASIDLPPALEPHPLDRKWASSSGRLWIQVDCRSVAELCCGRAWLTQPELRPLFVRISRALLYLYAHGLRPLHDAADMVIWAPREFNAVADHAVNCALDEGCSFSRCDNTALAQALLAGANLRLSVDGGRRSATQAAIGIALFAATPTDSGVATYRLLARSGKLLGNVSSAFLSEAIALEWGLQYLIELLKGKVTAAGSQ